MAFRTMLDTNIVSDLIRNPAGQAAGHLGRHGPDGLCMSIISAGEIRFGAVNRGSARLHRQIDAVLSTLAILPIETPIDIEYGKLRAYLKAAGTPIGPNDTWIAAHALTLGVTLITHNLAEFRRVPGLALESWLD